MAPLVEQITESPHIASNDSTNVSDVIVIGAGLAGKAASIHLAKAGLKVVCISPAEQTRSAVGESLDWSAPDLLKDLGLPMDRLIDARMATWKRHVTLRTRDGRSEHYAPSPWLGEAPLKIGLTTLHLDRTRFDDELLKLTSDVAVEFVSDKVVGVERNGDRVRSVRTAGGVQYSAAWFIDASGVGTSLFAREFDLPKRDDGPAKVGMWTYFPVSDPPEGTTLYSDPSPSQHLEWVWEIPVNPESVSVGFVTTGAAIKVQRDQGLAVDEIYRGQLAKFPRFEPLLRSGDLRHVNVTSFKCRVLLSTAGPNWLICGEAASMVDPITANGVTAALRHAAEASSLILKYRSRGALPSLARTCYSLRIRRMARFFNGGIEKIVYEPKVRNRVGLQTAGKLYTAPAWSMNVVYARLKPKGIISTMFLCSLIGIFRFSSSLFCRLSRRRRDAGISNEQSERAA